MEEYKVFSVSTDSWEITYNGNKYGLVYDYYGGFFRLMQSGRNLGVFTGEYQNTSKYDRNVIKPLVTSLEFKDGFITDRVHESLEQYKIKKYYCRKGNSYGDVNGNFVHAVNSETAFYRSGRYWYIKIGPAGFPEIEKSFFTLNGLLEFFEATRDASLDKAKEGGTLLDKIKGSSLLKKAVNAGVITSVLVIGILAIISYFKKKIK